MGGWAEQLAEKAMWAEDAPFAIDFVDVLNFPLSHQCPNGFLMEMQLQRAKSYYLICFFAFVGKSREVVHDVVFVAIWAVAWSSVRWLVIPGVSLS